VSGCSCRLSIERIEVVPDPARLAPPVVAPLRGGCELAGIGGVTRWCNGPWSRRWRPRDDTDVVPLAWAGLIPGDQIHTRGSEGEALAFMVEYAGVHEGRFLVVLAGYGQRYWTYPDPCDQVPTARGIGGSMSHTPIEQAVELVADVLGGTEIP
jgi:hypothetical protein